MLAESRRNQPETPIGEPEIRQALEYPRTGYFITTNLYWDCNCPVDFHRPADMPMCENCKAFQDESPDSRINELRAGGIHLDLHDPEALGTLEEHGRRERTAG